MNGESDYTIRGSGGELSGPIPVGRQNDRRENGGARRGRQRRRARPRKRPPQRPESEPERRSDLLPADQADGGPPEDEHSVDYLA